MQSENLMKSYKRLSLKHDVRGVSYYQGRAVRVRNCADFLEFLGKKLNKAYFCQLKLCPMCNWRRTVKISVQLIKVVNYLGRGDWRYIFSTYTLKSCTGEELIDFISEVLKAWNLFAKRKEIKRAFKGWFRSLEITHDTNRRITPYMWYGDQNKMKKNKSYRDSILRRRRKYIEAGLDIGDPNPAFNTYHVHLHVIFLALREYFDKSKDLYLEHKDIRQMWKECLKVDYEPFVDIRAIKEFDKQGERRITGGIAEVSKYVSKSNDYLIDGDAELTDESVFYLDRALFRRKLVSYGGEMENVRKLLNLDDAEDGDLLRVDDSPELEEEAEELIRKYRWHSGYRQYFLCEENESLFSESAPTDLSEEYLKSRREINEYFESGEYDSDVARMREEAEEIFAKKNNI